MGAALVADALDPGVLDVVDAGLVEGGVVEQDLDAIGSGFGEAANAPEVEQVGKAAVGGGVVAGLLVGEEEAFAVAMFGGGEAVLGIEEDGGGVAGEDFGDEGFEDFEVVAVGGGAALLGEGFLQGSALIHGGSGDDVALVGDGLEACKFSGRDLHEFPRKGPAVSRDNVQEADSRGGMTARKATQTQEKKQIPEGMTARKATATGRSKCTASCERSDEIVHIGRKDRTRMRSSRGWVRIRRGGGRGDRLASWTRWRRRGAWSGEASRRASSDSSRTPARVVLSSLCRAAVAAVWAVARSWARRVRAAAGLADDACGAGEGEVELEDESAAGVLVEEVGGGGVGGGEAFVDEDEGEVVAAQEGEGGAAAGVVSTAAWSRSGGLPRWEGGGFGGDEEKGGWLSGEEGD